jgi:hypothetical protein
MNTHNFTDVLEWLEAIKAQPKKVIQSDSPSKRLLGYCTDDVEDEYLISITNLSTSLNSMTDKIKAELIKRSLATQDGKRALLNSLNEGK